MLIMDKLRVAIDKLERRTALTPMDQIILSIFIGDFGAISLDYDNLYYRVNEVLSEMKTAKNRFSIPNQYEEDDILLGKMLNILIEGRTKQKSNNIFVLNTIEMAVSTRLMNIQANSPLDALFLTKDEAYIRKVLENSLNTFFDKSKYNVKTFENLISVTSPEIKGCDDLIIAMDSDIVCVYEDLEGELNIKYISNNIIRDLDDMAIIESLFI